MADQIPCPGCRHANPPENRFCGWCGASSVPVTSTDLMSPRAGTLTVMGHALPVEPGAIGTALAVGLGTLAMQVAMSWLRHRFKADDRPTSTLAIQEHDTALSGYLLGQGIEEILIQELGEAHQGRNIAWQAIRSVTVTEWTASSRRPAGRSRELWSSGGS